MSVQLTNQLIYSAVKPEGIPTRTLKQVYLPGVSTTAIQPGDSVRFEINSSAFLDPYQTYFNLDVSFADGEDHVIY